MEMKSFKTAAFGGFDKQDVLNAFEELSREYKKEKEEMQKEITQLKAKRFEAVTQLEKLKAGDKDRSDLIGKLQLLIKKQNADNDKLKQLNIAVEKHAKEIKTQNEQLQKRLQDVEGRTANETARLKKFDESGYTAERILSEANARSASTLADANNRASLILTEAAKKASANIAQSTKRAEEIIAKAEEEAEKLVRDAHLLEEAGCFGIVLEKIPAALAERVAREVSIPIIGIGAGGGVDGQVLVVHDMLGINQEFSPRFLRRYHNLFAEISGAVGNYINDVKSGDFPNEREQY